MPDVLIVNITDSLHNATQHGGWGCARPIAGVIEECTRGIWHNLPSDRQFDYVIAIAAGRPGAKPRTVRACYEVKPGSWQCPPNPANFQNRVTPQFYIDNRPTPDKQDTWKHRWEFQILNVLEVQGESKPLGKLPWPSPLLWKKSISRRLIGNGCFYANLNDLPNLFQ